MIFLFQKPGTRVPNSESTDIFHMRLEGAAIIFFGGGWSPLLNIWCTLDLLYDSGGQSLCIWRDILYVCNPLTGVPLLLSKSRLYLTKYKNDQPLLLYDQTEIAITA